MSGWLRLFIWIVVMALWVVPLALFMTAVVNSEETPTPVELPKEYQLSETIKGVEYLSPTGKVCNWVYQSPSGAGGLDCD